MAFTLAALQQANPPQQSQAAPAFAETSQEHAGQPHASPQQTHAVLAFAATNGFAAQHVFSVFLTLVALQHAEPLQQSQAVPAFAEASQVQAGQLQAAPQQAQPLLAFGFASSALAETPANAVSTRAATTPINPRRCICLSPVLFATVSGRPVRTAPVPRFQGGGGRPARVRRESPSSPVSRLISARSLRRYREARPETDGGRNTLTPKPEWPRHEGALKQETRVLEIEWCFRRTLRRRHLWRACRLNDKRVVKHDERRAIAWLGTTLNGAPDRFRLWRGWPFSPA